MIGRSVSEFFQTTWITICWKVIMGFSASDTKNKLPTLALIYPQFCTFNISGHMFVLEKYSRHTLISWSAGHLAVVKMISSSAAVCVWPHTHVWTYKTLREHTAVGSRWMTHTCEAMLLQSLWHTAVQRAPHTHTYIYTVYRYTVDGADGLHIPLHLPSHHALQHDWWVMM